MLEVTKIVQEEIADKVDGMYVEEALKDLNLDLCINFICTTNPDWKEETWTSKKTGRKYISIRLDPYEDIVKMSPEEVRALMLKRAEEKLGLVPG